MFTGTGDAMVLSDLRMSRSEFDANEDLCQFVVDNLHETKDVVKFFAGDWNSYIPSGIAPNENFKKIVDIFFQAYERKEPFLEKILTPSNVEKILNGVAVSKGAKTIGLADPGYVLSTINQYGDVSTIGFMMVDLKGFSPDKFDMKNSLDKKFYKFMVSLTAQQMVSQSILLSTNGFYLKPEFAKDVLVEADIRAKKIHNETGKENPFICLNEYINTCLSSEKTNSFYKLLDKQFLSKESYGEGWKGNYSHLISYLAFKKIFFSHHSDIKSCADNALKIIKEMRKSFLFREITFKNTSGEVNECSFRDIAQENFLWSAKNTVYANNVWNGTREVFSFLNKEFSYLKSFPGSIERFIYSVNKFKLGDNESFVPEKFNALVNCYDNKIFFDVLSKEKVSHPVLTKLLIEHNFDKNNKIKNDDNETPDGSLFSFKI